MARGEGGSDVVELPTFAGSASLLPGHLAVVVRSAVEARTCEGWARAVLAARRDWTWDFGGDQHCLGRAFYTHLETDRTRDYFDDAEASNARVDRHLPGFQRVLRTLLAEAVSGRVVARPGWCGAGVHVFPRGKAVATKGGVVHFDTEGLSELHVGLRKRALSLVLMLQPPRAGGGLRLWDLEYDGADHVSKAARARAHDVLVTLAAGDAVVFDSYRLHQIQPFSGPRHRLSASLHGARLDEGLWESWF